jgi:zona occludens toxin (predicted ATPase)
MVCVYTGTPGSGKSYHATERIDINLKHGVNIICNYVVKKTYRHKGEFIYKRNDELTVEFLVRYALEKHERREDGRMARESQTMVVIDEAHTMFNSRGYDMKERLRWLKFLACSRHLGYDVLLITQNDKAIDQQVRGLIEFNYTHRKLTNFGGLKALFIVAICRKKFVCVKTWYVVGEKSDVYFFNIKKKVAELYDTFAMFDMELDFIEEEKSSKAPKDNKRDEIAEFNKRYHEREENNEKPA